MCNITILPTTIKLENSNDDVVCLTYVLNKWLKMLTKYGKLDTTSLNNDFNLISKVIKAKNIDTKLRRAITNCRDYALAEFKKVSVLCKYLRNTLNLLCLEQEDNSIMQIKASYNDYGMIERYRPLSKRLEREEIRRIGKKIIYTDMHTDSSSTTKLVRRIVEKRAAQAVHRNSDKKDKETNRFRQSVRRATSFSLYNASFTEYDATKRSFGTHWKVYRNHGGLEKRLKAKHSYNSKDEATMACNRYMMNHPEDTRRMSAYKCVQCNKWHIGHERATETHSIREIQIAG